MNIVIRVEDLVSDCPQNATLEFCQVAMVYDLLKGLHPDNVAFVERDDFFFHKRIIAQKIRKILHIWPSLLTEFEGNKIFEKDLKRFIDGIIVMEPNTGELLVKPKEVQNGTTT